MTTLESLPAAGRELDAVVAENVFGAVWRPAEKNYCAVPDCDAVLVTASGGRYLAERNTDGAIFYFAIEPYSTDIAAAWEVVEKLETTHRFKLERGHLSRAEAVFFRITDYTDFGFAMGETAPLAICRAALKAVAP